MARRSRSNDAIAWSIVLLVVFGYAIGSFIGSVIDAISPILVSLVVAVPVVILVFLVYQISLLVYLSSEKFQAIKNELHSVVDDCNEMNQHIRHLRGSFDWMSCNRNEGESTTIDESRYNYIRPALRFFTRENNVYNVSRQIVGNVRNKPFYYICKYTDFHPNEANLSELEDILNNLLAAKQGQDIIQKRYQEILDSIHAPSLFMKFSMDRVAKALGLEPLTLENLCLGEIVFRYISPAGNSMMAEKITLDSETLESFVEYISDKVKFRKSIAGQRALMTSRLRTAIKERDGYTCRQCGNSTKKEENLLLEIDHIIPLAKGGITSEDNLQTLCWRCNRSKGTKIIKLE